MQSIFLVYKTDSNHSYASRDIIGVATTKNHAITLCIEQAQKEGFTLDSDQLFNIKNIEQTQGYEGEGEFHYEQMETDTLL